MSELVNRSLGRYDREGGIRLHDLQLDYVLPCPEQPEALAMPPDDGLWFYNDENGPPVTPDP